MPDWNGKQNSVFKLYNLLTILRLFNMHPLPFFWQFCWLYFRFLEYVFSYCRVSINYEWSPYFCKCCCCIIKVSKFKFFVNGFTLTVKMSTKMFVILYQTSHFFAWRSHPFYDPVKRITTWCISSYEQSIKIIRQEIVNGAFHSFMYLGLSSRPQSFVTIIISLSLHIFKTTPKFI